MRRQLLTEEVLGLPVVVRELAAQVQRQGEQIQALTGQVGALTAQVAALVSWPRGEAGRRDGERYEREIIRRAPVLFNGGQGGAPDDPWVRQRLTEQLRDHLDEAVLPTQEDPFLRISCGGRASRSRWSRRPWR